jgi:hypothetical protein
MNPTKLSIIVLIIRDDPTHDKKSQRRLKFNKSVIRQGHMEKLGLNLEFGGQICSTFKLMLFEYYRHNIHLNSLCKPTISKAL